MMNSEQPRTTKKPKRTRICGPQSKNACLTCKARRIKCDESKPGCLRCARSARVCEGYLDKERQDATWSLPMIGNSGSEMFFDIRALIEPRLVQDLRTGCTGSERQHSCAQRGINLLIFDSFRSFGASGVVLDILIPQLCHSIPSLHATAIALGAVHEMQASYESGSPVNRVFATSQYHLALHSMQRDLLTQPHGPIPLILMCFTLSVVELFLQQEENALLHLKGAVKLLQYRRDLKILSGRDQSSTNLSPEDHIDILFHTIDSQTCSYAMSKPPELPVIAMPLTLPTVMDSSSAHVVLVRLVHQCYNFTSINYRFKYQPQFAGPSIYMQQGRLIAHLSIWLEQFNLAVLPTLHRDSTRPSQLKSYFHALILRMTALSTLVYLSCILSPYETAYDAHASHFQQIIADGEALMSPTPKDPALPVTGINGQRFTAGPGLIQPVFMAAYKYREPLFRRRAIHLLTSAGCEGPWSGPREARITSRIMDLEEMAIGDPSIALKADIPAKNYSSELMTSTADDLPNAAQTSFKASTYTRLQRGLMDRKSLALCMADITEPARIHGMGLSMVWDDGRPSNKVITRFSRCWNIEDMLSYQCGHGPCKDRSLDPHTQGPCVDNIHWEILTETLEY